MFDSGLKGFAFAKEFPDEGYDPDKIKEGDILTCKIKNLNKSRCAVYLTFKENDIKRRQYVDHNRDPFYIEDDVTLHSEQEKVCKKKKELASRKPFKPIMIIYPRFQNMTADETMEFPANKEARESIIQPSSKGPSYLALTLKFYDDVYAHKDIVESGKDHKDMTSLLCIGKTLTIGNDTFEDIDELIFKIVEDHPRDVSQDININIIWGDESFPHLYENA